MELSPIALDSGDPRDQVVPTHPTPSVPSASSSLRSLGEMDRVSYRYRPDHRVAWQHHPHAVVHTHHRGVCLLGVPHAFVDSNRTALARLHSRRGCNEHPVCSDDGGRARSADTWSQASAIDGVSSGPSLAAHSSRRASISRS